MIEHEVKLAFDDRDAARVAIEGAGGRLRIARRLLDDQLFDSDEAALRQSGRALRIRVDGAGGFLTFKGPVQGGPVKSRQEIETSVRDPATLEAIVRALGFRPWFRAQKYREEYDLDSAHIALDETPMGVYIEIEASPAEIQRVAARINRSPRDYILDSYNALWRRWCQAKGRPPGTDMVFGD